MFTTPSTPAQLQLSAELMHRGAAHIIAGIDFWFPNLALFLVDNRSGSA
jgi:hypothetical protein